MNNHDSEVLEALRDDPELLAIADAVVETQSLRRRRRLGGGLLGIALAAAALFILVLASPWDRGSGQGTFLERALAVVGDDPVLHAVTEQTSPAGYQLVNLATGERTTAPGRTFRTELWYDPGRAFAHTITHANGQLIDDTLQTPDGVRSREGVVYTCAWIQAHPVEATRKRLSCRLDGDNGTVPRQVPEPPPNIDPGLSGFLTGYRQALQDGTATQVGAGTVRGRPVIWLEMHLAQPRPPGADRTPDPIEQRVAIDRDTYRPLLVRSLTSKQSYDVIDIETVSRDEADFSEPKPAPAENLVSGERVISSSEIEPGETNAILARPGLWAGESILGLPLSEITHDKVRVRYESGERREFDAVTLKYGTGEDTIELNESAHLLGVYGWISDRAGLSPNPPDGFARIVPTIGWAVFVRDGVYVRVWSRRGDDESLAVARALEPIP